MPGALAATNNAQTLLASTIVTPGTSAVFGVAAIGGGTGVLTSGLTNGVAVTSLSVSALTAAVTAGQTVTLTYQTHTAVVTAPIGAPVGATSITVNSFTPSFSFPSGTGVIRSPSIGDTALDSELARILLTFPGAGGAAVVSPSLIIPFTIGLAFINGYFPPTTAGGTYVEVGFFAGSAATATPGSGVLVFRAAIWWAHTLNADSYTAQLATYMTQV